MSTFNELEVKLREAGDALETHRSRAAQGKVAISSAASNISGLSSQYSSVVADINTEATNNPSDEAWQDLKRRKDKIISNFQSADTSVSAMVTALSGIDP